MIFLVFLANDFRYVQPIRIQCGAAKLIWSLLDFGTFYLDRQAGYVGKRKIYFGTGCCLRGLIILLPTLDL